LMFDLHKQPLMTFAEFTGKKCLFARQIES
jgi:hypothetical protein